MKIVRFYFMERKGINLLQAIVFGYTADIVILGRFKYLFFSVFLWK